MTLDREELTLEPEETREILRRLAKNARKLDRLLSDLLDLDRLNRGIVEPRRRPTDVGALVRRAVDECDFLSGREVRVEADHLLVDIDGPKVERIVENLLANAAKHTPPGTPVWVRAAPLDGGVLLVVEDSATQALQLRHALEQAGFGVECVASAEAALDSLNRALPDLLVIDGGKGQVGRTRQVLSGLGLEGIPVMGVAKGPLRRAGYESWIFEDGEMKPGPDHPASHLIQQIRDEAHRFAIAAHRKRRQKKSGESPLERIPGIGPRRRQALLNHFGGLKELKAAGVEELSSAPGISRKLAEVIYKALR